MTRADHWATFGVAWARRRLLRRRLKGLVTWEAPPSPLEAGCTALIGMCHRLPGVLVGNLRCLDAAAWPDLRHVVIVVDSTEGSVSPHVQDQARAVCRNLIPTFHYYTKTQAELAESLRLPFVFSWLSWCIGLGLARTRSLLIHDYDALILDRSLEVRHREFEASGAVVQGIRWYEGGGIRPSDRLATTFEMFLSTAWVRSFDPVDLFNQHAVFQGRLMDYDTTLEVQHKATPAEKRSIVPMHERSLVHPSQMIHQFTEFRRRPGAPGPCYSIPMIPFFEWLSGDGEAIARAERSARNGERCPDDFLGDGTRVNFSQLGVANVDWALKQMLQAALAVGATPPPSLFDYGVALYKTARAEARAVWAGDFTPDQRAWVDRERRSRAA